MEVRAKAPWKAPATAIQGKPKELPKERELEVSLAFGEDKCRAGFHGSYFRPFPSIQLD